MASQIIDEMSLHHICLAKADRPFHIYFSQENTRANDILVYKDGQHRFHYPEQNITLPIHEVDRPAIFYEDGSTAWMCEGLYHRWGGPAIVDVQHDQKQYWLNGITLSEDEYLECMDANIWPIPWIAGYRVVYVRRQDNFCIHREDGPAAIRDDGDEEWFLNGRPIDKIRGSVSASTSLSLTAASAVGIVVLLEFLKKRQVKHTNVTNHVVER